MLKACCFVCFVFQSCKWRGAKRGVLVRGPAASVWDHPSGKTPILNHTRKPMSLQMRCLSNTFHVSFHAGQLLCVFYVFAYAELLLLFFPGSCVLLLLLLLLLFSSVSMLLLNLDTEQKVMCNIHQQMSLCRFHGDISKCEMQLPPGLGAEGPPWNPAERIGRIVEKNCAFTSFPNELWLSLGSTFTNEHLFLLNPALECALCIQNSPTLVLYYSRKIFPLWDY